MFMRIFEVIDLRKLKHRTDVQLFFKLHQLSYCLDKPTNYLHISTKNMVEVLFFIFPFNASCYFMYYVISSAA